MLDSCIVKPSGQALLLSTDHSLVQTDRLCDLAAAAHRRYRPPAAVSVVVNPFEERPKTACYMMPTFAGLCNQVQDPQ